VRHGTIAAGSLLSGNIRLAVTIERDRTGARLRFIEGSVRAAVDPFLFFSRTVSSCLRKDD
jgi:hypothetical protein